MKKAFTCLFLLCSILILLLTPASTSYAGGSVAGTASATLDSICDNTSTNLLLTGYTGAIQWQSFNGTIWVNETGPGATTDSYLVTLLATTDFRAIVTAPACPSDTSNSITIVVGVIPPVTTGDVRCGYGPVTLSATGSGTIRWYSAATGGTPLSTGNNYTTNVGATTTFYASDASTGGGSETTPMPAQNSTFSSNARGYWFTAPSDFRITGLFVPTGNGNTQNIAVIRFVPAVPPPFYATVTNAFNTLFLTQNDTSTGVIPVNIQIYAGDVIGLLATRGTNDVNSYATSPATTTIAGNTVTISRMGMQFPLSTQLPHDIWQEAGGSISRVELIYETGCESPRTAAVATVNASTPATISASSTALCAGETATLTAVSNNPNYTFTWSPATGLSATTGTSVTANPVTPVTYVLVATDSICGAIDSVFIDVGPASVAGAAAVSTDTVCYGKTAILSLNGSVGNVQWQSNTGSGWVNETGPGNDSANYEIAPTVTADYWAIVTSGGCDPDTSIILHVTVLSVSTPVTTGDTVCGPDTVNLSVVGTGNLNWYNNANADSIVNTGLTYSPFISNTTTYYVESSVGGSYTVGPADKGFGNQVVNISNDWGLGFDVTQQITLDRVYIYPAQTGNVIINLRDQLNGPILNSDTIPVTQFGVSIPINLGWSISPGTGYRLELAFGSIQCYYNSTNATYPYTSPSGQVTITGYLNPNFNTGGLYCYFYNWQFTDGCKSGLIPVTGVVLPVPPVPVITANGTQLNSSAPANNQWYLNGTIIPGATGQTYNPSQPGSYTVVVTDPGGCTSTSTPFTYTGVTTLSNPGSGIAVYPSLAYDQLTVEISPSVQVPVTLEMYNALGEHVKTAQLNEKKSRVNLKLPAGIYSLMLKTAAELYTGKIIILE